MSRVEVRGYGGNEDGDSSFYLHRQVGLGRAGSGEEEYSNPMTLVQRSL